MAYLNAAISAVMDHELSDSGALHALANSVIEIDLAHQDQILLIIEPQDHIRLALPDNSQPIEPDIKIQGSILAFWRLAQSSNTAMNSGIRIAGDLDKAQQLQHWLATLDIDWYGLLQIHLGPTIAGLCEQGNQHIGAGIKASSEYGQEVLPVWLQTELNWLPRQEEVDDFCRQVHDLQADVERLCALWQRRFPSEKDHS